MDSVGVRLSRKPFSNRPFSKPALFTEPLHVDQVCERVRVCVCVRYALCLMIFIGLVLFPAVV